MLQFRDHMILLPAENADLMNTFRTRLDNIYGYRQCSAEVRAALTVYLNEILTYAEAQRVPGSEVMRYGSDDCLLLGTYCSAGLAYPSAVWAFLGAAAEMLSAIEAGRCEQAATWLHVTGPATEPEPEPAPTPPTPAPSPQVEPTPEDLSQTPLFAAAPASRHTGLKLALLAGVLVAGGAVLWKVSQ